MPNDAPLRIGFIGAGSIARQRHLPNLAKLDAVQVRAVCNRSEESSRQVAQDFGIPEIEADWRTLVERDDLDAIFIGTWPYRHREMSVAALEAGRHVFCQARMAMNLDEAKAMVAAAEAHPDLVHMICPPPHRMPHEPFIRRMMAQGDLGDLHLVRIVSLDASNADPDTITWRERVEYSGLQALQVGIWAETLHAFAGQVATLQAVTATPLAQKRDEAGELYEIRIPQIVLVQGVLESGAVLSEQHSGLSSHEQANFIALHGSKGTLRIHADGRIELGRAGEELRPIETPGELQRPWQVEQDFVEAVRRARAGQAWAVRPNFHEALQYMRKVQAIHDSAATGRAVRLSEL